MITNPYDVDLGRSVILGGVAGVISMALGRRSPGGPLGAAALVAGVDAAFQAYQSPPARAAIAGQTGGALSLVGLDPAGI